MTSPATVLRTSTLSGAQDSDIAVGDFDGDGREEWYGVWEAPNGTIGFSLPSLDR